MKIPETSANVGAYYGNEENGQWQPNGVIIDSGVGGGVVGSGDAGVHRPPVYPVHIPRGHIPAGYVMAGAYYPPAYPPAPPAQPDDFEDYMWMENEEEFDKEVMQQLEEEALMEQCIEAMLEDEREQRHRPVSNGHNHPTTSNGSGSLSLEEAVSRSTLNPLAAEFVPNRSRQPPEEKQQEKTSTEVKTESKTEAESAKEAAPEATQKDAVDGKEESPAVQSKAEETIPPPTDPPEVSAADVLPIDQDKDRRSHKDIRRDTKTKEKDTKKTPKVDVAKVKAKPLVVKSETKVQPKKKEVTVKAVKSEMRVEERELREQREETPVVEVVKQSSPPVTEESTQPGIKPINYAAAAKANKPKKPTTPPVIEKTPPPMAAKSEKIQKQQPTLKESSRAKNDKSTSKTERTSVQRKNSMK